MRNALLLGLLVAPTSAFARGGGGWGWIIIGAPFVLLVFAVLGGFATSKTRQGRRDNSGVLLIFIVSVFIGVPIAVLCAEQLAELVGVNKTNGAWVLLLVELACFVPYALWKEHKEKSSTTNAHPESDA